MVVERIGCVVWRRLFTRAGEPHRFGGPGSPRPWWGPEGADQYRSQVVGHVVNGVPAGSRGCGWRVVHSPGGRRCLDRLPSTGTCVGSPCAWTGRARGCRPVRCPLPRWPVERAYTIRSTCPGARWCTAPQGWHQSLTRRPPRDGLPSPCPARPCSAGTGGAVACRSAGTGAHHKTTSRSRHRRAIRDWCWHPVDRRTTTPASRGSPELGYR